MSNYKLVWINFDKFPNQEGEEAITQILYNCWQKIVAVYSIRI